MSKSCESHLRYTSNIGYLKGRCEKSELSKESWDNHDLSPSFSLKVPYSPPSHKRYFCHTRKKYYGFQKLKEHLLQDI